ncbi:MAG: nitric oxide reductase activation protein NorD [Janthinobacterium lividum]
MRASLDRASAVGASLISTYPTTRGYGKPPESLALSSWLLEALSGRSLTVQGQAAATPDAAPPRAILTSSHLLLPEHDDICIDTDGGAGAEEDADVNAEVNAEVSAALLQRACVAHAAAHLRYSPSAQPTGSLKPMSLALISAIEDARVEQLLMRELPGVRGWFLPWLKQSLQPRQLSFEALVSRISYALIEPAYCDDNYWVNKARGLFDGLRGSLDNYTAFREIASVLANDLGQMRVRFQAQQYAVPALYRDDNSYLWIYPEKDEPRSTQILQRDAALAAREASETRDAQAIDHEIRRLSYPEWDYRLELLRKDWCTVIERAPRLARGVRDVRPSGSIAALKLPAFAGMTRDVRLRRQTDGEELDLDAAVDYAIERRCGLTPTQRVFQRAGRRAPALSLLLLLDLSASTGDPADPRQPTGPSILDLEKDAALLLARAALAAGHRIAVHGFSSDTRACVNYFRLLEFGEPLQADSEDLLRSRMPRYSTRMGAAIRHATLLLQEDSGDRRAMIVMTDGAPSDIDVFDVDYLINDARAAVADAQRARFTVGGIAIDAGAADYMQRIVGRAHCRAVGSAAELPHQLIALFSRIARDC